MGIITSLGESPEPLLFTVITKQPAGRKIHVEHFCQVDTLIFRYESDYSKQYKQATELLQAKTIQVDVHGAPPIHLIIHPLRTKS